VFLEPDGDMNVRKDAISIIAGDRAASQSFDVRHMHLRPYWRLRVF